MKRALDIVIRTVLAAAAALLVAAVVLRYVLYPVMPGHPDIAHAGGVAADGAGQTESIDAITASAAAGFQVIEVDLSRTSDGRFVCAHDWNAFGGAAPDFAAFVAWRGSQPHPPCVMDELVAWFRANPATVLYVDIKQDVVAAAIGLSAALGERLIVDAPEPQLACALRDSGVSRIVFSTYLRPLSHAALLDDLRHPCVAGVEAVAVPLERALVGHGYAVRAATGLPVYLHTVDNCMSTRLARFLGADAVFTDLDRPDRC